MGMPLVLDHVTPRSEGGTDDPKNLCAACYRCNEFKGSKTHCVDPASGEIVPVFNPRTQSWAEHFAWMNGGTHIVGLTPMGRGTVILLHLNNEYVVEARRHWIGQGLHPPREP
ncbi:MAG: HNH endonuclease [Planctomycetes bacterium]|nr:HNH endonuclease [Planctomycetota bacterium]